jgi:hypothetical protein
MWLRPPNKYSLDPTATSDAAALAGGTVPEATTFDQVSLPAQKMQIML